MGVIDGRLAACKGVAARYHLTGQKAPSEPSSYVAHAAEPLAQFYETWSALLGDAQPDRAQVSGAVRRSFGDARAGGPGPRGPI